MRKLAAIVSVLLLLVLVRLGWSGGRYVTVGTEPLAGASRLSLPRGYTVRSLDRAVGQLRRTLRVEPGPPLSDEQFLRRAFLDLIGRPPTVDEWYAFMEDADSAKRSRLVRELVESDEFGWRWGRYWRQVMLFRVIDPDDHVEPEVLEEWLAEQINAGQRWSDIVKAIITARGRCDVDGPSNFILAHMARPNVLAAETARVFLGLNIACAECHDDPGGRWTREDFHGLAAFFARVDERRLDRPPPPDLPPDVAPPPPPFEIVVVDFLEREYEMPDPMDPEKKIVVERPRLLNGRRVPAGLPDAYRRGILAEWLTHRKNFWFARAYVNRIWFELFGSCFSGSPEDIGPKTPLRGHRVLYGLASAWQRSRWNPRWLAYVLARSDVYQRRCEDPEEEFAFLVGVPRKRLTAYQVVRSLETVLGVPREKWPGEVREQVERAFGVDPAEARGYLPPTVEQLLLLMNHPVLVRWVEERARDWVYGRLGAEATAEELAELAFVATVSRRPTREEVAVVEGWLRQATAVEVLSDLLWVLVNSDEFLYVP